MWLPVFHKAHVSDHYSLFCRAYVNDLTDYNFDRNTLVSLYADDTKISTIFSDVSERHNMQEHLNEFMRWAAKWQLQIAEHKCCVLSHGNVTQPIYYMHTVQLPNVNECRDLGVFVDSHCNFKHHISHICCKAYRGAYVDKHYFPMFRYCSCTCSHNCL